MYKAPAEGDTRELLIRTLQKSQKAAETKAVYAQRADMLCAADGTLQSSAAADLEDAQNYLRIR